MAAPYILAKSNVEANTFAQDVLGIPRGHYRIVTSPSSISGRRGTKLYLVPGYEKRQDRFAMAGALKYTRLEKIDGAALLVERYPDDERTYEIAFRYNRLRETPDGLEPAGIQGVLVADFEAFLDATAPDSLEEQVEHDTLVALVTDGEHETHESLREAVIDEIAADIEQAEEPAKQTRRRRCKECGALVEPADLEQHMADHLPYEE